MKKLLILFASFLSLVACTTEVEVDLPDQESHIVVEGWIENDQIANVMVTRSAGFFDPLDSNTLASLLVLDAKVTVRSTKNGQTESEVLTLGFDENLFPPIVYRSSNLKGKIGQRYDLEVIADGDTLTSSCYIKQPIALDSIYFELNDNSDSLGYLKGVLSDPDTLGNRYRFYTKRLNRDSVYDPVRGSLREDAVVNGFTFETFFYRGRSSFDDSTNVEEEALFRLGDTIDVKTTQLEFDHFRFWDSVNKNGGDSPFSSPSNIAGNINGGLGIWGSYAASIQRVVAIP